MAKKSVRRGSKSVQPVKKRNTKDATVKYDVAPVRRKLSNLENDFKRVVRLFDDRLSQLEETVATLGGAVSPESAAEPMNVDFNTVDESKDDEDEFDESLNDA